MIRKRSQTFLASFGLTALVAAGAIALLNIVVDPYGAFGGIESDTHPLAPYKPTGGTRIAKSERLSVGDVQVVLCGSSRAAVGLPPDHPAFAGKTTYNAGLAGTGWTELEAATRYAATQNPVLEQLVLVLDFVYFSESAGTSADFAQARFYPDWQPTEYYCRLVLGDETLENSIETLDNRRNNDNQQIYVQGQRTGPIISPRSPQHRVFADYVRRHTRTSDEYQPTRVEQLRELLTFCTDRGVKVTVVIAPAHGTVLEGYRHRGVWNDFAQWKRDLTAAVFVAQDDNPNAVTLWDFAILNAVAREPVPVPDDRASRMRWFWDPVHFTPALGNAVLNQALLSPHEGIGIRLDPVMLQAHLITQRNAVENYRSGFWP